MFENISFLFLFAMGLLSWAVLCFQHVVEIERLADYRVELYTERPEITFEPQASYKPSDPSPARRAIDFAISFWGILGVTYALSKLLQAVERQAKNYLKGLETLKPVNAVESRSLNLENPAAEPLQEVQQTLDRVVMVEENAALREQLNVLETHCLEMRELLHDLRLRKSSSSRESLQSEESIMVVNVTSSVAELASSPTQSLPQHTTSSSQQNIYITNSHIHIRGPVFCSDGNYSTMVSSLPSMYERRQSEFVQVWGKYITGPKERPMIAGSIRCNNILF